MDRKATLPSPRQYPHQWSWDAAFIAIGYSHYDQGRAQQELLSLFRGQWSNGMLPLPGGAEYFPGPDFWRTERSAYAPRNPRTSGIVQPPVHATAAWEIYRKIERKDEAVAFLEDLMPRLAAWHTYLWRERVRNGDGLVEIWHPWESGMDNSPLWDAAMGRLLPDAIPEYQRADLAESPVQERPSDFDYDRYVYLAALFRDRDYQPNRIRPATPFAINDVLYNTLFVKANQDLGQIARLLGADPSPFEAWATETSTAIKEKLWDDGHAVYIDFDLVADEFIPTRIGAGFSPLYGGVPSRKRARRMVKHLTEGVGMSLDETTWAVPSYDSTQPGFTPTNYWRGPIWINVNWVVYRGLRRYGYDRRAEFLRRSLIDLPRRFGFFEHYDPETGQGRGAEGFAWTAALVLNLVFDRQRTEAPSA